MRLLFVTERLTIIHLAFLLKGLVNKHEITVVTFDVEDNWSFGKDDILFKEVKTIPLSRKNFYLKALKALFTLTPVFVQTYKSGEMRKEIEQLCSKNVFDAVIFDEIPMGQYFDINIPYPIIFYPADALSRQKYYNYKYQKKVSAYLVNYIDYLLALRYERFILKKFDKILFLSEIDIEYVVKTHNITHARLEAVSHAVDTEYFYPQGTKKSDEVSLIFLGLMKDYKNEHAILWFYDKVWSRITDRINNCKLYIVGDRPSKQIQSLSSKSGNIVVTGFVDDLRPYIRDATLIISPLHIGAGIKNRVLQAMAMGKPVVATSLSMDGINAKDGVEYIMANTADEFVEKIVFLLSDEGKACSMGQSARSFIVNNHSIEVVAKRFEMIVNRLLATKGKPNNQ